MFKGEKIFQFIYGVLALACVVVIIMAIVGVILYFDRVPLDEFCQTYATSQTTETENSTSSNTRTRYVPIPIPYRYYW